MLRDNKINKLKIGYKMVISAVEQKQGRENGIGNVRAAEGEDDLKV